MCVCVLVYRWFLGEFLLYLLEYVRFWNLTRIAQETISNLEASKCKLTKELDAARKELNVAREEINVAREELDVAREELDAAKEEIDARIQHEVKITRELRTSMEEKSRFEKNLTEMNVCMYVYMCACVCVCVCACVCTYPQTCMYICVYLFGCVCICRFVWQCNLC